MILGHSLQSMQVHCIQPGAEALKQAMAVYTAWHCDKLGNVGQAVDQGAVSDFSLILRNVSIAHLGHVVVVHGLERQLVLGFLLAQHLENLLALGRFGLF